MEYPTVTIICAVLYITIVQLYLIAPRCYKLQPAH